MRQGNTRQKKMSVAPPGLLAQCFYGLLGLGTGLPLMEGRNSRKFSRKEVGISGNWIATHFLILQELPGICHGTTGCTSMVMRIDRPEDSSFNCCACVVLWPFLNLITSLLQLLLQPFLFLFGGKVWFKVTSPVQVSTK